MMSVLNHLSLVDCTTVKPAQERPGAAGGIRCPRPQVQLPFVSWYATSLSLSEASRSTASLRSIDGSSTVSFVIAMLRFPHLKLNIVHRVFDVVHRLLQRRVLLLDYRQLVVVLRYVRLSLRVRVPKVSNLLVYNTAVMDGRV